MFILRKMSSSCLCPLPTQWKECHLWEQFVSVDLRLWGVPDFGQYLLQSSGLLLQVLKFVKQHLNLREKKSWKKEGLLYCSFYWKEASWKMASCNLSVILTASTQADDKLLKTKHQVNNFNQPPGWQNFGKLPLTIRLVPATVCYDSRFPICIMCLNNCSLIPNTCSSAMHSENQ